MSRYKPHSVSIASEIKHVSTETFTMIGKMDKASRSLSKLLDKKIRTVKSMKSVSSEDISNVDSLRKAVESISAAKVNLVVKNYVLLDQNIKIVDNEIALLEKALIENGELSLDYEPTSNARSSTTDNKNSAHKKRKYDNSAASLGIEQTTIDPNEPVY